MAPNVSVSYRDRDRDRGTGRGVGCFEVADSASAQPQTPRVSGGVQRNRKKRKEHVANMEDIEGRMGQ